MKNQRGITLIALVITIIVLLILAGVSIAMLTGDNGLLTQSTKAVTETELAEIEERVNMELNAQYGAVLAGKTAFTTTEDATSDKTTINNNLKEISGKVTISVEAAKITVTVKGDNANRFANSGVASVSTAGEFKPLKLNPAQ